MPLTLRRRILAGYGLVLALLVVTLAWAVTNLVRLGRASEAILSENYESILAADRMIDALERQDSAVLLVLLGDRPGGEAQFRENAAAFRSWYARAAANVTIEGEGDVVAGVDSAYAAYLVAFDRLLNTQAEGARAGAAAYRQALFPPFMAVRHRVTDFRELNQETAYAASQAARRVSHRALWSLLLLGGAVLGLGLAFSLVLSSRLSRPVRDLEAAARRIAAGDYDVAVPAGASDELGRLAGEFTAMAGALRTYRALEVEKAVRAQRKSDAVLRSIDDGVVVLVEGRRVVVDLNPVAARALGVSADAARGRPLREVADEALVAAIDAAGTAAGPSTGGLVTLGHPPRAYQPVVTPMTGAGGDALGVVVLLRDVTELHEIDRMKTAFIATASHELRTPLTSIGMSIGLLEERMSERLPDRERALLKVASDEVGRLRALVDDLLDLSRIEAGRLELAPEGLAPAALVGDVAASFREQADQAGLALMTDVDPDLPQVWADPNKLRRILANLVSNALRHTDAGGAVRLHAEAADGGVRFAVEDTGEGIAPEDQARVFERFVQVESTRRAGGTGLGLAIAKELVAAHGGAIGVHSTPDVGSTFWFTIPVAAEAPAASPPPGHSDPAEAGPPRP